MIQITQSADKDPGQYDPNFTLSGMKDMYKPTRLLREPYLWPATKGYFEALEDLYKAEIRHFPGRKIVKLTETRAELRKSG